jgi:hypothetical protein
MARLKELDTGSAAERRYVAKKFIYLESEDDVQILSERWFSDRAERVEFLPAGDDDSGPGGCTRVLGRVTEDREASIEAYGIVDRDSLAREGWWMEFLEADDAEFDASKPFGEHVIVLRCWEIENYLLHPEVIEEFLSDEHGRRQRTLSVVLDEMFRILCCLIPITAADVILNCEGKRKCPAGFGLRNSYWAIYSSLCQHIEREIGRSAVDELDEVIAQIVGFAAGKAQRSLEHWLAQARIVDGKRLIVWLSNRYKLGERDVRWHLAKLTRDRGKIPEMLDQAVLDLVA